MSRPTLQSIKSAQKVQLVAKANLKDIRSQQFLTGLDKALSEFSASGRMDITILNSMTESQLAKQLQVPEFGIILWKKGAPFAMTGAITETGLLKFLNENLKFIT